MADSDGRDGTGSSSGIAKMKDCQLENQKQKPAAIDNPIAIIEEEEAREHQEAEPTLQETNRKSREEEEDTKRDAATGEENEEINEGAETQLPHGEMIKKRKTDHEEEASSSGCDTLVGGDLPGAQTWKTAMTMMGRPGSEVGGGVSETAAAEQRVLSLACKYCYWTFSNPQALGEHVNAYHRKPSPGAAAEKPKSGGGDGADKEAAWGVECQYCHRTFENWRGLMVHERVHARDPKLLQRQRDVIEMGKSLSASAAAATAADKPKRTGGRDGGDKDAAGGGVTCHHCHRTFENWRGLMVHERVHARDPKLLQRQRDVIEMGKSLSASAAAATAADKPKRTGGRDGGDKDAAGGGVTCHHCHRTFKDWRGLMVHERVHARDPKLLQRQRDVIEMGKSLSASAAATTAADKPKTTGGGDGGDKDAAGGGVTCHHCHRTFKDWRGLSYHEKVHARDDEWLQRQRDFLIMRGTSASASTAAASSDDVAAAADRPNEEDDPQGPPRPAGGGGGDGGSDNEGDDEEQIRWFVKYMVGKKWF